MQSFPKGLRQVQAPPILPGPCFYVRLKIMIQDHIAIRIAWHRKYTYALEDAFEPDHDRNNDRP